MASAVSASDAAEHGPAGADAVGCGERGEQGLGVDGLLDALLAGDGGERVGGESVAGGSFAPRGDEVVGGGVLLGGTGAQHDVLDLARMGAAADLGFELGEGVVDLGAAASRTRGRPGSVMPSISQPPVRPGRHRTPSVCVSWWRISAVASADAACAFAYRGRDHRPRWVPSSVRAVLTITLW